MKTKRIPISLSDDDQALIASIQKQAGIRSAAEVLRLGLRPLAGQLGVKLPRPRSKAAKVP